MIGSILLTLKRSRFFILSIFMTYWISCAAGIIMSHTGNNFALTARDRIVGQAVENDKASLSYLKGNNINAALYDFCGNLLLGAVPQTLMGFGIVIPYFTVLRQGWIGGIVSVDSQHKSRFKNFKSSAYYLLVLMLQFIPYSLAIGCGIRFGVDFYNNNRVNGWEFWKYKIQKSGIKDLIYIYILVIPLFFLASCFEFLSSWNI